MRVINKKMVVVVLLIIEFTCGYLMYQSSKKEVNLDKVTYEEEINNNMFAMYVENEDTGEYDEITDASAFPDGYKLNSTKTGCIDNKGNSIENVLNYKNGKVTAKSNKTIFCYLYFDIDKSVYQKVKNDYQNSSGALLLSETESNEYPVYYYSGDITNNNILYGNFCWKMVRTTETGGVKLIYNGVPDKSEDGSLTCDNTGEETLIGSSKFNEGGNSLAYVGYMYNTVYNSLSRGFQINVFFLAWYPSPGTYYYGDTTIWNSQTNQYVLSNSAGSEVTTYVWADNYTALEGKYTCRSGTATSCNSVCYVAGTQSNLIYCLNLSSGKDYDEYKIKLAPSVTDNGDGTYTLVDSSEVLTIDWFHEYSDYTNYYICKDDTCSDAYYLYQTNAGSAYAYSVAANYKYGSSIKYEDGVYQLEDTIEFWNWRDNYNKTSTNRYTCFNTTGECEEVYYIHKSDNGSMKYIKLQNGVLGEEALNNMLYAEDVNKYDSVIKETLDTWYENNLLNYANYLEDTIWCNSRETSSLYGSISFKRPFYCSNKLDQFTLKVDAGGTEGYGNNALDYPIGLLTRNEASMAGAVDYAEAGYLNSGSVYWLMSPTGSDGYYYNIDLVNPNGYGVDAGASKGVRPSVSLSNNVEITSGDGSVTLPYQIQLSS